MIILEVLVGPDVIQLLDCDEMVRELLDVVRLQLGPDLHHLVAQMTIYVSEKPIKGAIAKSSAIEQKAVKYAVECVEKAKAEGRIFGDLLEQKKTAKKME